MKINVAVQCMDKRLQQIGTFGYYDTKLLYSVTPVFQNFVDLLKYCERNKLEIEREEGKEIACLYGVLDNLT